MVVIKMENINKIFKTIKQKFDELRIQERIFLYMLFFLLITFLSFLFSNKPFFLLFANYIIGFKFYLIYLIFTLLMIFLIYLFFKGNKKKVYLIFYIFIVFNLINGLFNFIYFINSLSENFKILNHFYYSFLIKSFIIGFLIFFISATLVFTLLYINRLNKILTISLIVLFILFIFSFLISISFSFSNKSNLSKAYSQIENYRDDNYLKLSVVPCKDLDSKISYICFYNLPKIVGIKNLSPNDYHTGDFDFGNPLNKNFFYYGLAKYNNNDKYCYDIEDDSIKLFCIADVNNDESLCKSMSNKQDIQVCEYVSND